MLSFIRQSSKVGPVLAHTINLIIALYMFNTVHIPIITEKQHFGIWACKPIHRFSKSSCNPFLYFFSLQFVGEQLIRPAGCRFYRVPIVIEKGEGGERAYDIYSRLLLSRIVCVFGPVRGLPKLILHLVCIHRVLSEGFCASKIIQSEDSQSPIHTIHVIFTSQGVYSHLPEMRLKGV